MAHPAYLQPSDLLLEFIADLSFLYDRPPSSSHDA
jgi:hypothetical protein